MCVHHSGPALVPVSSPCGHAISCLTLNNCRERLRYFTGLGSFQNMAIVAKGQAAAYGTGRHQLRARGKYEWWKNPGKGHIVNMAKIALPKQHAVGPCIMPFPFPDLWRVHFLLLYLFWFRVLEVTGEIVQSHTTAITAVVSKMGPSYLLWTPFHVWK